MMIDTAEGLTSQAYFLYIDDQRWPCLTGDVIGRAGTVAADYLRPVPVLSRRHLLIECRNGTWFALALPEARNETYLDGLPMQRGLPYPLTGLQYLQVDSFHFQLGPAYEAEPLHAWTAPTFKRIDSPDLAISYMDETHPSPATLSISQLPAAIVETDLRLRLINASPLALTLLGEQALGHDFDALMPDPTRLRNALLRLEDHESSGPLQAKLDTVHGPLSLELLATRCVDKILIYLRDISSQEQQQVAHQKLSSQLASQSALLAELSLSRAFQEGDVAKSLTLLAHRTTAALDCRRVSVWLKPEAADAVARQVVCQACHDPLTLARPGTLTDLDYCPLFFNRLATDQPWAIALANSPVLNLLQQIHFAQPDTTALLCLALQHADGFYGVLCLEKSSPLADWSEQERQFALALASYGVLALQTRERRQALRQLQSSEARMTAELEEANHYIQRVLPSPLLTGPITAEWHMQPAEALGGDSFGYHWVGDLFVMYVLDVVGHGTGMALLSISVLNNVRARLLLGQAAMADPAGVLMDLNAAFPMENQNNMLFSMWYGVFDRHSRQLTYASAGHPPAILLLGDPPEDGEDYAALGTDGPSVGAIEGMIYSNGSISVEPGCKLYIFTDGAFEIPLGPDREWTFDEFTAVVRSTRYMENGEPAYLRKRVGTLCSIDSLPDDFTIVRFSFVE